MISALIVLFIQFIGNPNALYKTLSHPVGSKIALMGGLLMFFGFTWMVLLARRRV
jgi:Flp pilus assembly protein TadB